MSKNNRFSFKFSIIFSSVIFVIALVLFYYMDLQSLTVWTLNIWDTLAQTGNIRNYYEYSAMNLYQLTHAMVGSDILIYLPWAIWNLPIWLLQRFAGLTAIDHFGMMLYSKLFLLAVFVLVLFLARKIANLLVTDKEDVRRMLFLSAGSFFTITSLAYIGQNDVMVIAPFLAGIYELLKGNHKRFVLWAALSIAFKPFFVFSYIAIILLIEKNLLKDFCYLIGGFSIYFLQKILFIGAPCYSESLSYGPTGGALELMLKTQLDIPPSGLSLFFLGMGIVWLMAYFSANLNVNIIYYATAPMIIFFLFTRYESYRPFYLVPLLFLLMMIRPAYKRINLLLEMAATGSLMYFYLMDDVLFYNPAYMLKLNNTTPIPSISGWITSIVPGFGYSAFTAVFVLAMILILIINHPSFHIKNAVLEMHEEPWLLPVRSLLYGLPVLLSLLLVILY